MYVCVCVCVCIPIYAAQTYPYLESELKLLVQVNLWRRSYDMPPPKMESDNEYWAGKDPRYGDLAVKLTNYHSSVIQAWPNRLGLDAFSRVHASHEYSRVRAKNHSPFRSAFKSLGLCFAHLHILIVAISMVAHYETAPNNSGQCTKPGSAQNK